MPRVRPRGAGWPAWLVQVVVHAGLVQAAVHAARPAISYRALELGVPPAWLGPISATFAVLPLLTAMPLGRWLDGHRALPLLMAGTGILIADLLLLASAGTVAALVGLTMGLGLSQLLLVMAAQDLLASGARGAEHDRRFGAFAFAVAAGQMAGPFLLALPPSGGVGEESAITFIAAAAAAAIAAPLLIRLAPPPAAPGVQQVGGSWGHALRHVLAVRGVRVATAASLTAIATVDLLIAYLPALGAALGLSAGTVGLLLSLRAGASLLSRATLGALVRRWGRARLQVSSLLLAAAGVAAIAVAVDVWTLGAAVVVAGLALGVVQPLTMALVADAAPAGTRGTALGFRLTGNRLGQLALPLAAGAAAGAVGVPLMLAGVAGLVAAVAVGARGERV